MNKVIRIFTFAKRVLLGSHRLPLITCNFELLTHDLVLNKHYLLLVAYRLLTIPCVLFVWLVAYCLVQLVIYYN